MHNQGDQFVAHVLDTYVQPLLTRLLDFQGFGASRRKVILVGAKSKDNIKCDYIDLSVPYGDVSLKWTILFDLDYPESGPDFLFNDEFLFNPDVNVLTEYVPSLHNWNYCDSNSLLFVIKELLAYYKRTQIQMIKNRCSEKLLFEYEQLVQLIDEENVEVIFTNKSEVKFFISLTIDFSRVPQRYKHQPQNDAVILYVTFSGSEYSNVVPQLYLTKPVENILGNQEHLTIPPYPSQGLLIDYVPTIKTFLQDKVEFLISNFKKKRDFLSQLLSVLRGSIIEYDTQEFNQATFLVEKKDFHFFIHFRIGSGFPREKPTIAMESAYHMDQSGKMITQSITKFQYNREMDPSMMVQSILSHIEDKEIEPFQQMCTRKNRF